MKNKELNKNEVNIDYELIRQTLLEFHKEKISLTEAMFVINESFKKTIKKIIKKL